MNHIAVRRISLSAASVSFGVLTAIVLLYSVFGGNYDRFTVAEQPMVSQLVETTAQKLSFPVSISCTTLVVEDLAAYDGAFYEDGSGREVRNVAALMLRNTGEELIPYAHVVLHSVDSSYVFEGYMIPAGAAVLIPEKNARQLSSIEVRRCFGWATVLPENNRNTVSVSESGMNEILVTNRSESPIYNMTIYHKTYLDEWGFYMGGKAFETQVGSIVPGQTVTVYPDYYVSGYSKIVYYE